MIVRVVVTEVSGYAESTVAMMRPMNVIILGACEYWGIRSVADRGG